MAQTWTYETLAQADKATLENVLLTGTPPDVEQLNGYIYCGWNHEPVGKLSGEKFKRLLQKDGRNFGYNETVIQDHQKFNGKWEVGLHKVRPNQLGYFRVSYVKDEPYHKLYQPYLHLAHFNYNVDHFHKWYLSFFRVIRDFVVLPNEGDHSLMLCKAYLHFTEDFNLFTVIFYWAIPKKIRYLPW